MKKLIITVIVLALLGLGGRFLWQRYHQNGVVNNFRTQKANIGQLRVAVGATGTINPVMVVNVGTQISGTIKELFVDFNDAVTAGQLLMTLDDQLFKAKVDMSRANLANSQAQLKLAQLKFDRQARLFQAKTSTQEEYDTAQANLEMAKASVAQHEASLEQDLYNLNNTRIISPVDGVVVNRGVDVGQTVAASFQTPTLINIAGDLTKMQINASFAEADIGRLTPGLDVVFSVDAYPGDSFKGVLRQIRLNPTITSNVVTYDVVIDVDNPDLRLLPGMTAYVDIELYREDDVLLVPNTALNFRPTGVASSPGRAQAGAAAPAAPSAAPDGSAGAQSASAPAAGDGPAAPPPEGGAEPAEAKTGEAGTSEPSEGGRPGGRRRSAGADGQGRPEGAGAGRGASARASASTPEAAAAPAAESHGRVYVLDPNGQPRVVELTLGATDLRSTVVKAGTLKAGDLVIVGENLPEADRTLMSGTGMGPGGGRRR